MSIGDRSQPETQRPLIEDEEFTRAVAENVTIAGVLRSLGRAYVGTNYKFVHREVERLGLDTSHWEGMSHGTGGVAAFAWEKVLVEHNPYRLVERRKRRLIKEDKLINECAICGCLPEWQGKPLVLVLVLDHANGVRNDNRIGNLRLVCPNCNSQLPTFTGRNKRLRSR